MTGGQSDFTVNFGIGQWNADNRSWNWADFGSKKPMNWIGDAMGWAGLAGDAFKLQQSMNSGRARGERDIDMINNPEKYGAEVYTDEGGVNYVQVESLPSEGDAFNVIDLIGGKDASGYSDVKKFKIPELIQQHPGKITDFRTLWGHYKQGGTPPIFEFHPSQFPVKGLGGLIAVPHVLFESGAWPSYYIRHNILLPTLTQTYHYQYLFGIY